MLAPVCSFFSLKLMYFCFLLCQEICLLNYGIFEELCMRLWISFKSYFSWPSLALLFPKDGGMLGQSASSFSYSVSFHTGKRRDFFLQLSSDEVLTLYQVHSDTTSVKNKKGYFVTLSCEWIPTCSASLKVHSHHLDLFDPPSRWWESEIHPGHLLVWVEMGHNFLCGLDGIKWLFSESFLVRLSHFWLFF